MPCICLEKKDVLNLPIPGEAIPIRLRMTWVMPHLAAVDDFPTTFPFSSVRGIPSLISCILINGMLTQLAAATAAKGTKRPTRAGIDFVRLFRPKAVTRAPEVASTYEVPSCLKSK